MRIIVAITGATGAPYGIRLLAALEELGVERHLILSRLENILALSRMGAVIAPPVPAFYTNPQTIDELIDHTIGRVLNLFGLEIPQLRRWAGMCADSEFPALVEHPRVATKGS
jgi:3-polyprenyl-4-hydroxybenzoate decarboxylase